MPFLNNSLSLKVVIDVRGRENLISSLRTHPNLAAWYIADEPQTWDDLARLESIYNTYKPTTPHPMFMANLPELPDSNLWQRLVNLGDIACIDVYPKSVYGYYPDYVSQRVRAAAIAAPGKPLIYISQAFGGDGFLEPTPSEYLDMVAKARSAGATGILVFTWASRQITGGMGVTDSHPLWPAIIQTNSSGFMMIPALILVAAGLYHLVVTRRKKGVKR